MSLGRELEVMARRAHITPGSVSWDEINAALQRQAKKDGEWAGAPIPVKGMRMVIHPSYPFAERLSKRFMPEEHGRARVCRTSDVDETTSLRNEWRSYRDGRGISIWHDKKGYFFTHSSRQNTGTMLIDTIGAARGWSFEAEIRAQETLKRHLTQWAFECYLMTGSFLETSRRSGVIYLFRRLRPTLAMTGRPDQNGRDRGVRFLCSLCLHPIGYYDGSWAGALVPTDDVISHLLLMRSDEHRYWAQSNQHPASAPESGL